MNLFHAIPAYRAFEGAVIEAVEQLGECCTSDAQGIVDAQAWLMWQAFGADMDPAEAAAQILAKGAA